MASTVGKMGEVDTLRFYMARAVYEYQKKSCDGRLDWSDIIERSQCEGVMTVEKADSFVRENFKKRGFDSVEGFLFKLRERLQDGDEGHLRDYLCDNKVTWSDEVIDAGASEDDEGEAEQARNEERIPPDSEEEGGTKQVDEKMDKEPSWLDIYSVRLWVACDMIHAMEQDDIDIEITEDEEKWQDYVLAFEPKQTILELKSLSREKFDQIRTPDEMKAALISCWAMGYDYHGGTMPDLDRFCALWIFEQLDGIYHDEGPKFDLRDVESSGEQTLLSQVVAMGIEAGVLRNRRNAGEWARWFVHELFHNEDKWIYFNTLPGVFTTVQYEVIRSGRENKWWGFPKLTELNDLVETGAVSGMKRLGLIRKMP